MMGGESDGPDDEPIDFTADRHGLAALCLYGQPFGFTWDDVAMLEDLDRPDLASRIAALLPPKRG